MTRPDRHDRDRWIASGLPDAVVTIMFRDGTLPPPHAARWYDSSLTTDEIVEFRRAGRPAPDEALAASLEARGLPTDPAFVAAWKGFDARQILDAIDRGFRSGEQYAPWAASDADITEVEQLAALGSFDGYDPGKVLAQLRAGHTPDEIAFALEAGLKTKKAVAWMSRGVSATTARDWSEAGFSASKAAQWIKVVDDPKVAGSLRSLGLDVDDARAQRPEGGWTTHAVRRHVAVEAGAGDDVADEWASTSLSDRKLAKWVAAGVRPVDAGAWRSLGFDPEEASGWAAQRFTPEDAGNWRRSGVDPEIAARRRDAGVRPPIVDD
ncbi:MAG: hypothetical protein E4H05_04155 [Acidimicrobiales bacterium]|nr:MAG: hypothetical protein E4H05_04155 [Acidimicrobiales bacterium]